MNDTGKRRDPQPIRDDVMEQLKTDYIELETEAKYVFRDREPGKRAAVGGSRLGQQHPTERAEQPDPDRCSIAGPNGTRILHNEGHAWMYANGGNTITIRSCMSCHRIDWDDVNREVRKAQAKALREAAEINSVHMFTAPRHGAIRVNAVWVSDLERRAAELERGDTDAS